MIEMEKLRLIPHNRKANNLPSNIINNLMYLLLHQQHLRTSNPPIYTHSPVVCLEFQTIRFVISIFTPIFFIKSSFVLLPPPLQPGDVRQKHGDGLEHCEWRKIGLKHQ